MKSEKKKLKDKCDLLWSKIIKNIGECEKCHSRTKALNSAHIMSRRYLQTRWDLENGLCLCVGCHFWAHQNPIEFTHWVEEYLGEDIIEKLRKKANYIGKVDLEEVHIYLKGIYERTKN